MSREIQSLRTIKTEVMCLSTLYLENLPPSHQVLSRPAAAPSTGEHRPYLSSLYRELVLVASCLLPPSVVTSFCPWIYHLSRHQAPESSHY